MRCTTIAAVYAQSIDGLEGRDLVPSGFLQRRSRDDDVYRQWLLCQEAFSRTLAITFWLQDRGWRILAQDRNVKTSDSDDNAEHGGIVRVTRWELTPLINIDE